MPALASSIADRPIRVMVVDDSVVIRRLVTMALEEDPAFEVAGVAANGKIALAKIPQLNPDVITLDIEMPEMNGLETLAELRKKYPKLRVVMFSTLTQRGADATLEALALGADDYVTKAANVGSLDTSLKRLREELGPKIKQFFGVSVAPIRASGPRVLPALIRRTKPLQIIAIGVSTGGPNALAEIIPKLPGDLRCPVVITQHMPEMFTRLLAERLDSRSELRVEEAETGSVVEPGKVIIAAGKFHLRFRRQGADIVCVLDQGPMENSCRPAVDVMFRSVREMWRGNALAVILTGMGKDGFLGIEDLKKDGCPVIAQDKATSVVWGMPGYVVEAGLADQVVPLDAIAQKIQQCVR